MIFLLYVHIHLANILHKYGWNHDLYNKLICISMTGGLCIRRSRNLRNEIHLTKILLFKKLNFIVVCHKIHYHLKW